MAGSKGNWVVFFFFFFFFGRIRMPNTNWRDDASLPVLVIIGLDSLVSPVNNCIRAIDPSSPLSSRSSLSTERVEGVRRGANSRFISVGENSSSFVASFLLFFSCECKLEFWTELNLQ